MGANTEKPTNFSPMIPDPFWMSLAKENVEQPLYEYVRIPVWMIHTHIQELYGLSSKIVDGHVYMEIRRGMYGLPQASKLANEQLEQFLAPHGYFPCPITPPGLWTGRNSDLMFTLVGLLMTLGCNIPRKPMLTASLLPCRQNTASPPLTGLVPAILVSPWTETTSTIP